MLSKERHGKFTGSGGHQLFVGGKGVTRDKYIQEVAVEAITKQPVKRYKNKSMDHGHMNEYEAITTFKELTGLLVEYLEQKFFPINENCGATPDAWVVDFSGVVVASADVKCPTGTFFEQKMTQVKESKPKYQNVPKESFYQAQMQMMALTKYNEALGHPPVTEHYLVRYLTAMEVDDDGNKIEYDLPLNVRLFYKKIIADPEVQKEILDEVAAASLERDAIIQILLQPII
jgi:hypothetical protein